jgi:EmrB/QacA subfamily drug resistance transporter
VPTPAAELLELKSARGRLTLATVTLGSGIALLDGTVVNIAVRQIGIRLDASLGELQWVINGYALSLASLILVGGALGDRLGRRRLYLIGIAGFAIGSALCAFAQDPTQLVVFRVLQGVAAALVAPGALAIIQSSFVQEDRASAIGTWAGMAGIAAAAGPFIGGFLLEHGGWRWIFAINLPLCAIVLLLGFRIPESRDTEAPRHFDWRGALTGVVALGSSTYVLTSWPTLPTLAIWLVTAFALATIVLFVWIEDHPNAMVPVDLWRSRVFSAANVMTLLTYGALSVVLFFLVLNLQVTSGYTAIEAGLATLPITLAMLFLSRRFSRLSTVTGPRLPMTVGPLVCATGTFLLSGVGSNATFLTDVLPGITIFALGLSMLVSPLTVAVLAAAPDRHAGIASGVNNAVARTGSLLAIAALPAIVGLTGDDYRNAAVLQIGYHRALLFAGAMLAAGGLVSWVGLRGVGRVGHDDSAATTGDTTTEDT